VWISWQAKIMCFKCLPSLVLGNNNIPSQTAKDFITGATVDMGSFLVSGASGVPLAAEVAVRDPTKFGGALIAGAGLVIGSTAKMAIDDPARFAGSIAGGAALGRLQEQGQRQRGHKAKQATQCRCYKESKRDGI
jgi:hypothetical protein